MVISSYQKSANPSRSRRKNLSRNEKSNDTANKNRLCRRLADTRDLKSLSGDRVRVRPPSAACESLELFVDPNDSGLFLFAPFAKFMLDICTKLWYNISCSCGYSTSASISAFQAEEVGSIPITRSKRPEP